MQRELRVYGLHLAVDRIQKLVGIGPDAGEQLDFEVRLEYPGEDQGPQVL